MKKCSQCGEEKPESKFGLSSIAHGRKIQAECKKCLNKRAKDWYYKNKHDPKFILRTIHKGWWHRYQIEPGDVMDQMNNQKGCCAICNIDFSETKKTHNKNLGYVIDHNHKSGHVRGLLCISCNIMLGYYEKHIQHNISKIRGYLKEYEPRINNDKRVL